MKNFNTIRENLWGKTVRVAFVEKNVITKRKRLKRIAPVDFVIPVDAPPINPEPIPDAQYEEYDEGSDVVRLIQDFSWETDESEIEPLIAAQIESLQQMP